MNTFAFTSGKIVQNGRVTNIPFDFQGFLTLLQNILIPISHVLKYLMKKLEILPFYKIENSQNLARNKKSYIV